MALIVNGQERGTISLGGVEFKNLGGGVNLTKLSNFAYSGGTNMTIPLINGSKITGSILIEPYLDVGNSSTYISTQKITSGVPGRFTFVIQWKPMLLNLNQLRTTGVSLKATDWILAATYNGKTSTVMNMSTYSMSLVNDQLQINSGDGGWGWIESPSQGQFTLGIAGIYQYL